MPSVRKPDAPAEIQLMSDSELANQLRSRGVDVGPIIATTRKVYERKLAELLQGGPPAHVSSSEGEEEEMEDVTYEGEIYESEEPEIVPASKSSGYQSSIRHRAHIRESYSSQQAGAYSSHSYSGSSVAAAAQSSKPVKKKGMSLVAKLIILVIIAVLVYLVVVNMEGTRPKPPTLTQDSEKGKTET